MYTNTIHTPIYNTIKFGITQGLHRIRTLTTIADSFIGTVTLVTRAVGYTCSALFTRRHSAWYFQHETNTNVMTSKVRSSDKHIKTVIAHDYAQIHIREINSGPNRQNANMSFYVLRATRNILKQFDKIMCEMLDVLPFTCHRLVAIPQI